MARLTRVRTRRRPRPDTIDATYDETVWEAALSWCAPGRDRNLDGLPDYLTPPDGCPVCGSVYVDLSAIGFMPPHPIPGRFVEEFGIVVMDPPPVYPSGVELVCFEGHHVEWNAHTRTLRRAFSWSSGAVSVRVDFAGPVYALGKS
jgi:hypothetical protein